MCSKGLNLLVKVNNIDTQALTIQTDKYTQVTERDVVRKLYK